MTRNHEGNGSLLVPRNGGRPRKGEEKIDLVECWRLRVRNKLTYQEIADHFGCAKSSVIRACQRLAEFLPDPASVEAYSTVKAEILEGVEAKLLASLTHPDKIAKASLNNVAFSYSQVANQLRLERGKSTHNTSLLAMIVESDALLAPKPGRQRNGAKGK